MRKNVKDLFDLTGKVAAVIGGAQNLGYDMAEALAEAGADVVITSRDLEKAESKAKTLAEQTGRRIVPLALDATNQDEVKRAFARIVQEFGRLDVLINNAGGSPLATGGWPFLERTMEDFDLNVNINLRTMFLCTQEAVRIMLGQGSGSIINIASITGIIGRDYRVYPPEMRPNIEVYNMCKGGVIAFTRDIAAQMGKHGIRVNCISPGGFERGQHPEFIRRYSEKTPLGRMGRDGIDLKGAAVFLASEASAYVTGHNLVVDGGFTIWQ